jgi:hypothetical protein
MLLDPDTLVERCPVLVLATGAASDVASASVAEASDPFDPTPIP